MKLKVRVFAGHRAVKNEAFTVGKHDDLHAVGNFVSRAVRQALRELPVRKLPYCVVLRVDAAWVD